MKCPHCSEDVADAVPRERLNAKSAEISALKADLEKAVEAVASSQSEAKKAAKLREERDAARADLAARELAWTRDRVLLEHGVTDPDDQWLVTSKYDRLPAEERPELAAWLKGPAREDRQLGYLWTATPGSESDATDAAAPAVPPAAPRPAPSTTTGVLPTPAPGTADDPFRRLIESSGADLLKQYGSVEDAIRAISSME